MDKYLDAAFEYGQGLMNGCFMLMFGVIFFPFYVIGKLWYFITEELDVK